MTGSTSASFSGFGSYIVDAGASLTLTGANTLTTGQSLTVAGTLTNTGTLAGPAASGYGVKLSGGTLTNGSAGDASAVIAGYGSGVHATGASATISNFGSISCTGRYGDGVDLGPGGRVTNGSATDSTALIYGYFGVSATGSAGSAGVTVTNFGTIDGTNRTAVGFTSASDRLIVEAGSALTGDASGGGGTLELAGGSDKITGLGGNGALTGGASGSFYGFGSYLVDGGASVTLGGANTVAAGQIHRHACGRRRS